MPRLLLTLAGMMLTYLSCNCTQHHALTTGRRHIVPSLRVASLCVERCRVARAVATFLALCCLALGSFTVPAAADCSPLKPPAVITTAGCYRLTAGLETKDPAQFAVTIANAGNVSLDLGGHTLTGAGAASRMAGVHAYGTGKVRISNGTISGFRGAVRVDQHPGSRVSISNITATGNFLRGIQVEASQATITRNTVRDTRGAPGIVDSYAIAVEFSGERCRIQKNAILGLAPLRFGEGVGISITSPVKTCRIENNTVDAGSSGPERRNFGLWVGIQPDLKTDAFRIRGNTVRHATHGYLASLRIAGSITRNIFDVHCGPHDTRAAQAIAGRNTMRVRQMCYDTVVQRQSIARNGPEHEVRYAIALIELLDIVMPRADVDVPDLAARLHEAIRILKASSVPDLAAHVQRAEVALRSQQRGAP